MDGKDDLIKMTDLSRRYADTIFDLKSRQKYSE